MPTEAETVERQIRQFVGETNGAVNRIYMNVASASAACDIPGFVITERSGHINSDGSTFLGKYYGVEIYYHPRLAYGQYEARIDVGMPNRVNIRLQDIFENPTKFQRMVRYFEKRIRTALHIPRQKKVDIKRKLGDA